ncbi:hypothetical protein BH11PLA2_BH11PLA2_15630 [soil metagenome]
MAKRPRRSEPGISRIDQPERRTFGWFVRVSAHGHLLSKFFPDRTHGSKPKAFAAAKKHRDKVRSTLLGSMKAKPTSEGLKRFDTVRDKGWTVQVDDRVRQFSDTKHGGPAATKAVAASYRKTLLAHLGLD